LENTLGVIMTRNLTYEQENELLERHWQVYQVFGGGADKQEFFKILSKNYRANDCDSGDLACFDKRFKTLLIWTIITVHAINLIVATALLTIGAVVYFLF
jgi:hypothetical protein